MFRNDARQIASQVMENQSSRRRVGQCFTLKCDQRAQKHGWANRKALGRLYKISDEDLRHRGEAGSANDIGS